MRRSVMLRGAALLVLAIGLSACAPGPVTMSGPTTAGTQAAGAPGIFQQANGRVPTSGQQLGTPAQGDARRIVQGDQTGTSQASQRPGTLESSPTGDELSFVTDLLRNMQRQSYATGRETCGYIGRNAAGQMMATRIAVGDEAACWLPQVPAGMRVLASVHTHGTYSPVYASEFPTVQDMMTDAQDGIDGYISTPGGRMWYVDTDTMTVRQLCGRGCLPQDPNYRPEDDGPVRPSFTIQELRRHEAGY